MVIETFRPAAKADVYRRLAARGRMLPPGLHYLDSWLEHEGDRCFQLMETPSPSLFDEWTSRWSDLVEFENVRVDLTPNEESEDG